MKKETLEKSLTDLGLTENEAKIYFSGLSLGPTTVLKLARAAEMKRTTAYSVIESLRQKGMMSVEASGFKKLFAAEDPSHLNRVLEARRERLQKVLPELSALYNLKGGESFIKYYEGLAGIKSVYEGLLKDIGPGEDYDIVSNVQEWYNLDPKFFQDFTERRAKLSRSLGFHIRLLLQQSETAEEFKQREKTYNIRVKMLPQSTSLLTSHVVIPKRVIIHQLAPPIMALVIENRSIIQMHQQLFGIIWNALAE